MSADKVLKAGGFKAKKKTGLKELFNAGVTLTKEYAATLLVVAYVVNGVLASAILFDIVNAPQAVKSFVGALSIAYSAVGFVMFINRGVKHQLAERNK